MYVSDGLTAKRISDLMQELESGQYKKEILPNSSYEMSGERQAMYFSHARENLKRTLHMQLCTVINNWKIISC